MKRFHILLGLLVVAVISLSSYQPASAYAYTAASNSDTEKTAPGTSNSDADTRAEASTGAADTREAPVPRVLPDAVLIARAELSRMLKVPLESIEIVDYRYVEWRDSCLELAPPGVGCLTVITPGWRVIFEVGENYYVARTDLSGRIIRWEPNFN